MNAGTTTLDRANVGQTLTGLIWRRYYAIRDKNDSVIRTLQEAQAEMGFPPTEPDSRSVASLSAGEKNGEDIPNLSGREVFRVLIPYEIPQR